MLPLSNTRHYNWMACNFLLLNSHKTEVTGPKTSQNYFNDVASLTSAHQPPVPWRNVGVILDNDFSYCHLSIPTLQISDPFCLKKKNKKKNNAVKFAHVFFPEWNIITPYYQVALISFYRLSSLIFFISFEPVSVANSWVQCRDSQICRFRIWLAVVTISRCFSHYLYFHINHLKRC